MGGAGRLEGGAVEERESNRGAEWSTEEGLVRILGI